MTSNPDVGHIVAMGGGGFSMDPENPLLDNFVLGLSRRQPARGLLRSDCQRRLGHIHREVLSCFRGALYRN